MKRRSDTSSTLIWNISCLSFALAVPSPGMNRRRDAKFPLISDNSCSSSVFAVPSPAQRRRMDPTSSVASSAMEIKLFCHPRERKNKTKSQGPRPQTELLGGRYTSGVVYL